MPEPDTMHLCSNPYSRLTGLLIVATLWALPPTAMLSQAPAPQVQAPEQQKPLTEDRDPVRSPDAESAPPPAAAEPGKGGDITRGSSGKFTLRRDVDEVILNATVLDDNNHLVNSLNQEDFTVTEDGVPQKIASFLHEDSPVSLGLVVDNSGSMLHKRSAVNTAAVDLVKASNPKDEAFVVNFSDEAYIDQDFTSDTTKLREGLGHIDSKGGTAMYDAVVASADQLAKYGTRPKQVLVIITDGEDNASTLNLEQTIRRIQELQGPTVYSIGLLFGDENSSRENRRAKRALQLLSNETGGIAFFPKSLNQVDEIAAEVAKDIRNQYSLGYHSSKPVSQGGYRLVHVEAKSKGMGKLIVRTRTGYFPRTQKETAAKTAGGKAQ
jgi:Ca-activated chloride channel family protein